MEQVAEQMEQLIEQGQWKVGEKLPPEMELMDKFGVSRQHIKRSDSGISACWFIGNKTREWHTCSVNECSRSRIKASCEKINNDGDA